MVPIERLPEALRVEWAGRARNGCVMLALKDAYALLTALGDDLGRRFGELELAHDQRSPLVARNQSILAHGFEPVGEIVYNQLHAKLCSLPWPAAGDSPSPDSDRASDWRLPALGCR